MTSIRPAGLALLFALGTSLPACDLGLVRQDSPERAHVTVTGRSGPGTVSLLTSNAFRVVRSGERPDLLEADTTVVELPFEGGFDLGPGVRFYVRTFAPDSSEATLTMRVLIEADERYDETRTVTEEGLEFMYLFRGFGL